MNAPDLRPLRIGEILDVAIKIYRSHFATLIKAVALVVAPVQVLAAIIQASAPDNPASFPKPGSAAEPEVDLSGFWAWLAAFLVVGLLGLVAGQLATAASLKAVSEAYLGEPPQWRQSLRFAVGRLGSLVWLAVLTTLLLSLALLGCVVPAIYFYGAWAVAVPVLLLEDVRGRRALKRSRALVRDRWWPTFGAILLGALLAGAVQASFGFLLVGVTFSTDNELVLLVSQAVTSSISGILATPFSAALTAVVYFDLRVRKEGLDLELLAQRIDVARPAGGAPVVAPPTQGWPPPPQGWPPPGAAPPHETPYG